MPREVRPLQGVLKLKKITTLFANDHSEFIITKY